MEFSIRLLVVIVIALILFVVIVSLATNFGTQSNSAIDGLFSFFNNLLSGKQASSLPPMPK
jgi:hypothetical protein